MRGAERVADLAEGQQPAVGVGPLGEPAEHAPAAAVRWIAARRLTPAGERLEVAHGAGRVAVAERRQPSLGRLGRRAAPRSAAAAPRPPAAAGRRAVRACRRTSRACCATAVDDGRRRRRTGPERAAEPPQVARQPSASGGCAAAGTAGCGARARAGPGRPRRASPRRRGRRSHRVPAAPAPPGWCRVRSALLGAAVHELEQLHAELDVAQPAGPELELPLGLAAGTCCSTRRRIACTSATKLSRPAAPHDQRADGRDVRLPELAVTGHRAGLEQRLELPGLGPPLVVGAMALRVRTSGPSLPSGRSAASTGHSVPSPGARRSRRASGAVASRVPVASAAVLVDALARLDDEDHVDVADVVELASAALAHADHREVGSRSPWSPQLGAGDRQRGLQRGRGQVGQLEADRPSRRAPARGRGRPGRRRGDARQACRRYADPQRVVRRVRRRARRPPRRGRRQRSSGSVGSGVGRRCPVVGVARRGGRRARRTRRARPAAGRGPLRRCAQGVQAPGTRPGRSSPRRRLAAARSASIEPDEAEQRLVGVGDRPERRSSPSLKTSSIGSTRPASAGSSSSRTARAGSANPSRARVAVCGRRPGVTGSPPVQDGGRASRGPSDAPSWSASARASVTAWSGPRGPGDRGQASGVRTVRCAATHLALRQRLHHAPQGSCRPLSGVPRPRPSTPSKSASSDLRVVLHAPGPLADAEQLVR